MPRNAENRKWQDMLTGEGWSDFKQALSKIRGGSFEYPCQCNEIGVGFADETGKLTAFFGGLAEMQEIPGSFKPEADMLILSGEAFPVTPKTMHALLHREKLDGEAFSSACAERSAMLSRVLAQDESSIRLVVRDGVIAGMKVRASNELDVVKIVENALPEGRRVSFWSISPDVYRVRLEYFEPEGARAAVFVEDSDTGASSLTIRFGVLSPQKKNFFQLRSISIRHDNAKVTLLDVMTDIQKCQFPVYRKLLFVVGWAASTSAKELKIPESVSKLIPGKQKEAFVTGWNESMTLPTLENQIWYITDLTAEIVSDWKPERAGMLTNAVSDYLISTLESLVPTAEKDSFPLFAYMDNADAEK